MSPYIGRAFREVVAAVCEEQPLVMLVDDVDWLDRDSLLAILATLGVGLFATMTARFDRELDQSLAQASHEIVRVVRSRAETAPTQSLLDSATDRRVATLDDVDVRRWAPGEQHVTATLHDIYTLRGTLVRDPLNWTNYIGEALVA